MDRDLLLSMLAMIAGRAPSLIAESVGLIMAIVNLRRHPAVARLALVAFAVLLISTVVATPLMAFLPMWLTRSGKSISQMSPVIAVVSIFVDLIRAGCLGLVIAAIFGWRGQRSAAGG